MHRRMNGVIGATAAQIDHRRVDLRIARLGRVLEQRRGRHHLAGLAVTALGDLEFDPGGDDPFADIIRLDGLDGGDLPTYHTGDGRDARAHHVAVHQHRTRTALRQAAAVFGTGHAQVVADDPEQGRVGFGVDLVGLLVNS